MAREDWDDSLTEWMEEAGLAASVETALRTHTEFFKFFADQSPIFAYSNGIGKKEPNFKVKCTFNTLTIVIWVQYNSNIKSWCVSLENEPGSIKSKHVGARLGKEFIPCLVGATEVFIDKIKARMELLGGRTDPKSLEELEKIWRVVLNLSKP
jgi:hypothetical protein